MSSRASPHRSPRSGTNGALRGYSAGQTDATDRAMVVAPGGQVRVGDVLDRVPSEPASHMTQFRPRPSPARPPDRADPGRGFAAPAAAVDGDRVRRAGERRSAPSSASRPVSHPAPSTQVSRRARRPLASTDFFAHDLDYVASRLKALGVCYTTFGEIIAWDLGYPTYDPARTIEQMVELGRAPRHHGRQLQRRRRQPQDLDEAARRSTRS